MAFHGETLVVKTLHHHLTITITITTSHSSLPQMLYTIDAKPPSSTLLRSRHLQNNFPEQRQADVPPPSPPPPKNPRPPGDTPTTPLAASAPARPAIPDNRLLSPLKVGFGPIRAAGPKGEGEGKGIGKDTCNLSRIRTWL
ncbi:hypothetical protein CFAM422_002367 [Trichoderma lentiforme]|uniref:Uncharacterized protein n=1 Tax=Trichoderma lentiforme TaxID=1567552 RepID=A0A9P5CFF6_9HYPO|nr:hypothetical protein CFAM422_002367 [Trichoderma lentiforme]